MVHVVRNSEQRSEDFDCKRNFHGGNFVKDHELKLRREARNDPFPLRSAGD